MLSRILIKTYKRQIMKNVKAGLLALGIATSTLFAFNAAQDTSIKGTVSPAEAGVRAWALSATDTLKAPVDNGAFEIPGAKAGTYRIIVEAKAPYKNAAKENVTVEDGKPTDVGEIKLSQ
jgi:hypothetical protein